MYFSKYNIFYNKCTHFETFNICYASTTFGQYHALSFRSIFVQKAMLKESKKRRIAKHCWQRQLGRLSQIQNQREKYKLHSNIIVAGFARTFSCIRAIMQIRPTQWIHYTQYTARCYLTFVVEETLSLTSLDQYNTK